MDSLIKDHGKNDQYSPLPMEIDGQNMSLVSTALPESKSQRGVQVQTQQDIPIQVSRGWQQWYDAFKHVWPIYLATHIAFLILTYLAALFTLDNFSGNRLSSSTLLQVWSRWDTAQFTDIATHGYEAAWRTAFFPLYPFLEASMALLTRNPFIAGLVISNLAALTLFMVLYRLVREDFGQEQAYRTVLYLAVFPTAFFFVAAYNESLFLCLTILSFYYMRRGQWWWAGLFGFFAALTRSAGLLLLIPFCYEYIRQHHFKLREMLHIDSAGGLLIPAGTGIFAIYCAIRFHDLLAFSHTQSVWHRQLSVPGLSFIHSLLSIKRSGLVSFTAIHNGIDLSVGLFMLVLTVLCFIGPWKFSKDRWVYGIYIAAIYFFLILFPSHDTEPLQSLSRLVLELFPAFILLAALGKKAQFNLYYLTISGAVLCFMLLQFLTGGWIV